MMRISAGRIADTMLVLLQSHMRTSNIPTFWVWARADRAIVSVNPTNLKNIHSVASDQFAHDLSTSLGGCRVVKTNSRGVYFQIAYNTRAGCAAGIPPARPDAAARAVAHPARHDRERAAVAGRSHRNGRDPGGGREQAGQVAPDPRVHPGAAVWREDDPAPV